LDNSAVSLAAGKTYRIEDAFPGPDGDYQQLAGRLERVRFWNRCGHQRILVGQYSQGFDQLSYGHGRPPLHPSVALESAYQGQWLYTSWYTVKLSVP
jgi:hypothetical protein